MAENIERFNSVASINSIVRAETLEQYKSGTDVDTPYSLGEWLVNVNEKLGSPDEYIQGHVIYIREWYKKKKNHKADVSTQIVNNYVRFLKEVVLTIPTNDEYRYLSNLDWESPYDLDIAVPYYASRLREIVLYIVGQRERIRFQKVKNSIRGSVFGSEKHIYDHIISLLQSEDYVNMFGTNLPDIKDVARDLNITIDEVYDDTQNYNNVSLDGVSLSGERTLDSLIFTDFNKAVINILQSFPQILVEDGQSLTTAGELPLQPTVDPSMDQLSALPGENFSTYTNNIDKINLHLQKQWYTKYIGTDMYYLSSNDSGEYTFNKFVTSNSKAQNHLNVNTPSVVFKPTNSYVTSRKIGGMFIRTGITHAYSLNTTYAINTNLIPPDTYDTIPDPNIYYSNKSWLEFNEDYSWMMADRTNDQLHGHIIDSKNKQKMYPYQSTSESNNIPKFGVSRITDRFDFWDTETKDVWANADVYKVVKPLNYTEPRQERIDDLLMNAGSVTNWETDIHGNEYALYKPLNDRKQYEKYEKAGILDCKVLDGEFFWDDVTWERPGYDTYVDGTSSFMGWGLTAYNEYAYGGYFRPYDCGTFECFCPCEEYVL